MFPNLGSISQTPERIKNSTHGERPYLRNSFLRFENRSAIPKIRRFLPNPRTQELIVSCEH